MKFPWCSRDIGFPPPGRTSAQCPVCNGQVTYAFRARRVVPGLAAAAVAIWFLIPWVGPAIVPIALAAPVLAGMYLDKWY